ncbi:LysR family transcriptional regulator, partial [Mesorhizobium sp. M8A.F.Ca.ET.161.01.1.1]|uniref:LysR family transcriptional regulator n=1 Tax=Mesorhizobium sp. M8A.F.Ca.ET.161.01.1.1 TaxID=2563959 RepID=UPI00167B7885
ADRLGIGRSAVSRSVQKLESQLGVRLFLRTTRSTTLTREGELFLEGCNPGVTCTIVRQAPAQPAPKPDPVVQQVQGILKDLNFYDGTVDGLTGPATRKAIQAYQLKVGLP